MPPLDKTRRAFATAFGAPAALSVQAPGRVNLIGEHTDYNDGFVLPCAIDYHTVICGSPRSDRRVQVIAVDYAGERDEFSLDAAIEPRGDQLWANYVRGVVKCLRDAGHQLGGGDLTISGNVPQGAGRTGRWRDNDAMLLLLAVKDLGQFAQNILRVAATRNRQHFGRGRPDQGHHQQANSGGPENRLHHREYLSVII